MTGIFNGLQALLSSFRSLIAFIQSIWSFLVNLIKSIGDLFTLLLNMLSIVSGVILTLPSWLIAFATLTVGICVLYLVVGRNHG